MTGEPAADAARSNMDTGRDLAAVSEALEALRLAWGDACMFGHDEKGYWAAGHHPGDGTLRADTPGELDRLLAAGTGANPADGGIPPAAENAGGSADGDALRALRYDWGGAYRIGWDPRRRYWARRRDGLGGDITAADPAVLGNAIREDYERKPVPRDYDTPPADA